MDSPIIYGMNDTLEDVAAAATWIEILLYLQAV